MIFLFVWCHASEEDVVDLVAPENQGIFGPRDKNYFKNGRTCFIIFFFDEKPRSTRIVLTRIVGNSIT